MCCIVKGMEPAQDTERPTEPPLLNITFYYSSQVEYSGIHYAVVLVHKKKQINPHTHTKRKVKTPHTGIVSESDPCSHKMKWNGSPLATPYTSNPVCSSTLCSAHN